jgi:hypothetical protein
VEDERREKMINILKRILGVLIVGGTISGLAYILSLAIKVPFLTVLKYIGIATGVAVVGIGGFFLMIYLLALGVMLISRDI